MESLKRKAEDSPPIEDGMNGEGGISELEVPAEDLATVIRVLEMFGKDVTQLHRCCCGLWCYFSAQLLVELG